VSVLVKGMEMPDRCFACPMCDDDCCGISKGSFIEYREVDVDVAIDSRPNWCPLIPAPPHGRLIDADALMHDTDNFIHKTMLFGGQYVYSEDAIKNAPTIIPAEEGE